MRKTRFTCPRRLESGNDEQMKDVWGKNGCTWCGSMDPEVFIEGVKGGVLVGPTDKSYKLYVGEKHQKFYTKHLSPEQGFEFRECWLRNEVNWGYPGGPYVPLYIPGPSDKEIAQ